jgi:transmembrane sensor
MNTHQTTDNQARSRKELIAEEAADWVVCYRTQHFSQDDPHRDPVVRDKAFFEWVKQSPTHVLLFMEMMEIERRFNRLDSDALAQIRSFLDEWKGEAMSASPAKEGFSDRSANEPTFRTPRPLPLRQVGLAAAVCAAAVGITYFSQSRAEVYSTPIGQQREFILKDGTSVKLNTDSVVEVAFSDTARSVELVRGEAYFTVNPDIGRPFTVASRGTRIQDIGTAFNVRLCAQSVNVAVTSGMVKVGADVTLGAGHAAEVIGNKVVEISEKDAKSATAWLQGLLVFDKRRLEDAVAEFNRYNPGQIVIEGSGVQDIPVTGMFKPDRSEDFITYVRAFPSLSVDSEGNHWVIRLRN